MNPLLTIITVNFNTSDFISNQLNCLHLLTKSPYCVLIADNNSSPSDLIKLNGKVKNHPEVKIFHHHPTAPGSLAHGEALNFLISRVSTPYFSVLDSDAVWLKKNWDELLINQLTDKVKIIGTGSDGPTKPQDFPAVYGFLAETNIFKKLNVDMRPNDISPTQDTSSEMRQKFLTAGYQGKVLIMKNTRIFKQGPFASLTGIGEYYDNKRNLLISHFGRGSSLGAAKYYKSWMSPVYHLPKIGPYLLKRKGENEKSRWFAICRQIVNNQLSNDV